jgi:hypothetical protein
MSFLQKFQIMEPKLYTSYNIKVYLIYKINQFNKSELFLTYSYVPEYGKLQFGSVPLLCSKKSRDNEPSLWPGCSVDNGVRKNIFKRNRIKINAIQDLNKMTLRLLAHYWKRVYLLLWSLLNSWRWRTIYWRRW